MSDLGKHPDALQLVAFAEGRLLDLERERIERHLADCRPCRQEVAELARESQAAADEPVEAPVLDLHGGARGQGAPWGRLLAAAAVLLAVVLGAQLLQDPGARPGDVELALAPAREELFGNARSGTESDELYVGLRLDRPAWLRLVALLEDGSGLEVPLDPDGRRSLRFEGGEDHSFGPYPRSLGQGRDVRAVLAITSDEELTADRLAGIDWSGLLEASARVELEQRLAARVVLQSLP